MGRSLKKIKNVEMGHTLLKCEWGEVPIADRYRYLINRMKHLLDETGYDFITANMLDHKVPLAVIGTQGYDYGDRITAFYPTLLWISKQECLRRETSVFEPGTALYFSRPEKVITKYYNRMGEKVYTLSQGKTAQVVMQACEHLFGYGLTDNKPPVAIVRTRLEQKLSDEDREVIKSKWGNEIFKQ